MGLLAMLAAEERSSHTTPTRSKALRPKAAGRLCADKAGLKACWVSLPPQGHFCAQLASSALLQCLPFFFGMLLNQASDKAFATAVYDDDPCCPTNLTAADRREARRRHDIYHGLRHVFAGVFCFQHWITVEGLTGRLSSPMGSTREEWVAMGLIMIIPALFSSMQANNTPFWVMLHALAAVEVVVIAFGAVALRRLVRRHHQRRRRIYGDGSTPPVSSSPATPSALTPAAHKVSIRPIAASELRQQGPSLCR